MPYGRTGVETQHLSMLQGPFHKSVEILGSVSLTWNSRSRAPFHFYTLTTGICPRLWICFTEANPKVRQGLCADGVEYPINANEILLIQEAMCTSVCPKQCRPSLLMKRVLSQDDYSRGQDLSEQVLYIQGRCVNTWGKTKHLQLISHPSDATCTLMYFTGL